MTEHRRATKCPSDRPDSTEINELIGGALRKALENCDPKGVVEATYDDTDSVIDVCVSWPRLVGMFKLEIQALGLTVVAASNAE